MEGVVLIDKEGLVEASFRSAKGGVKSAGRRVPTGHLST